LADMPVGYVCTNITYVIYDCLEALVAATREIGLEVSAD